MQTKLFNVAFVSIILFWIVVCFGIEKGTVPNRFTITPTIRRSDVLQNFDSANARQNRIIDSLDIRWPRYTDFDTHNFAKFLVDTLKSTTVLDTPTIRRATLVNSIFQSGNMNVTNDTVLNSRITHLTATDTAYMVGIKNTGLISSDSVFSTSLSVGETIDADSIKATSAFLQRLTLDSIWSASTEGFVMSNKYHGQLTLRVTPYYSPVQNVIMKFWVPRLVSDSLGAELTLRDSANYFSTMQMLNYGFKFLTGPTTIRSLFTNTGISFGNYAPSYVLDCRNKARIDTIAVCDTSKLTSSRIQRAWLDTIKSIDTGYAKNFRVRDLYADTFRSSDTSYLQRVKISRLYVDTIRTCDTAKINNLQTRKFYSTGIKTDTIKGLSVSNVVSVIGLTSLVDTTTFRIVSVQSEESDSAISALELIGSGRRRYRNSGHIKFINVWGADRYELGGIGAGIDENYDASYGRLKFWADSENVKRTGMIMNRSGYVGIGTRFGNDTTSPEYNLDVLGKVRLDTLVSCDTAYINKLNVNTLSGVTFDSMYTNRISTKRLYADSIKTNTGEFFQYHDTLMNTQCFHAPTWDTISCAINYVKIGQMVTVQIYVSYGIEGASAVSEIFLLDNLPEKLRPLHPVQVSTNSNVAGDDNLSTFSISTNGQASIFATSNIFATSGLLLIRLVCSYISVSSGW